MEQEILSLEKQLEEAIVANDADAIDGLLAEDWVVVGPDGSVNDKSRFLMAIRFGILSHQAMSSEDVRVSVHGGTATVTALTTSQNTFMGKQSTTLERSTDVFAQENGQWKCVLTHLTRVSEK